MNFGLLNGKTLLKLGMYYIRICSKNDVSRMSRKKDICDTVIISFNIRAGRQKNASYAIFAYNSYDRWVLATKFLVHILQTNSVQYVYDYHSLISIYHYGAAIHGHCTERRQC